MRGAVREGVHVRQKPQSGVRLEQVVGQGELGDDAPVLLIRIRRREEADVVDGQRLRCPPLEDSVVVLAE